MTVTLLLLAASVAIVAGASVTRLQVTANRELTIAIVDTERTTRERNEFRAHVAALLTSMVNQAYGSNVAIKPVFVGGRDAQAKLAGGAYDAALVIGSDRPFALRRTDFVTLAGTMPSPNGLQPVCLVVGNADASLNEHLRTAFERLVSLSALTPYRAAPAPKLASIGG